MKNAALFFGSLLLVYLFAEVIYSALVVNHIVKRRTIYFTEAIDPNGHIHFDSEIGYRMSKTPARYGSIVSDGRLQSMGVLVGNNYGLPDKRTFFPKKPDSTVTRIAVLGDSFTASQFTERGWLSFFQDSLNKTGTDSIELLNFSVDGGGLANWHGIMESIILKDEFDIDGVIYAICGDDLSRTFHYRHEYLRGDDGNQLSSRAVGVGYHDSWLTNSYPLELDEAEMWFSDGWVVMNSDEIDEIEGGNWKLNKEWSAYFTLEVFDLCLRALEVFTKPSLAEPNGFSDSNQLEIIERMTAMHRTLCVPTLCLSLCATNEQNIQADSFASMIGASYIQEVQPEFHHDWESLYIEGDGHWTLAGAEFFAKNNHNQLQAWINHNFTLRDD